MIVGAMVENMFISSTERMIDIGFVMP